MEVIIAIIFIIICKSNVKLIYLYGGEFCISKCLCKSQEHLNKIYANKEDKDLYYFKVYRGNI